MVSLKKAESAEVEEGLPTISGKQRKHHNNSIDEKQNLVFLKL